MTDDKKDSKPKRMTKEQYLKTHLLDMDDAKRRWYIGSMENWKPKDYDKYTRIMLDMLGEPTEEDMRQIREFLKKKNRIK